MKIHITNIISHNQISKKDLELVKALISKHAKKIKTLLPFKIKDLTFTFYAWEKEGLSAFTQAKDWVDIKINFRQLIKNDKFDKKLQDQLVYVIYHEMHHTCRGYAGILPKNKEHILINSIISEGLADHFAIEQYPVKHVLETKSYELSEVKKWIKKFGKVMWNKESEDDSWLYGGDKKPKMLGYKIGRYMIHEVKSRNPKLDSVKMVNFSPERIIKLSGIDF